jgi:DNA-binding transcriptional LysR family regulator
MEIDNLKAFLAVAETRPSRQVADGMHLTRPAISKRVAQLEQQLDAQLFDRIGRSSVRLTEAGNSLEYRANLILQQVEDTERAIRNLNGEVGDQPPRRSLAPAPRPKQVHSKTP